MSGLVEIKAIATDSATTSETVAIPQGYTLVGVEFPVEVTSTTFTIAHGASSSATFLTLKDPLGIYSTTAGNAITFTIGATSLGIFTIYPIISALLYSNIKIIMGSTESAPVTLIFKGLS